MGNCFCNPKHVIGDVKSETKSRRPTDDIPYTDIGFQEGPLKGTSSRQGMDESVHG